MHRFWAYLHFVFIRESWRLYIHVLAKSVLDCWYHVVCDFCVLWTILSEVIKVAYSYFLPQQIGTIFCHITVAYAMSCCWRININFPSIHFSLCACVCVFRHVIKEPNLLVLWYKMKFTPESILKLSNSSLYNTRILHSFGKTWYGTTLVKSWDYVLYKKDRNR